MMLTLGRGVGTLYGLLLADLAGLEFGEQNNAWRWFTIGGGLGVTVASMTPYFLRKVWPAAPTSGIAGHGIKIAGVLVSSYVVTKFLKQKDIGAAMLGGGLGFVVYHLKELLGL